MPVLFANYKRQVFSNDVNEAQMMSISAMMIHISDSTRRLLEKFRCFITEERGLVNIKVMIWI